MRLFLFVLIIKKYNQLQFYLQKLKIIENPIPDHPIRFTEVQRSKLTFVHPFIILMDTKLYLPFYYLHPMTMEGEMGVVVDKGGVQ